MRTHTYHTAAFASRYGLYIHNSIQVAVLAEPADDAHVYVRDSGSLGVDEDVAVESRAGLDAALLSAHLGNPC